MKSVNTAFYLKMQEEGVNMAHLIDLETPFASFRWTSCNQDVLYTLSGALTRYSPFPGVGGSAAENVDMSVAEAEFTLANTGDLLPAITNADALAMATVKIGMVHVSTPDLGRMEVYHGQIGDVSFNRLEISGGIRNIWKSLAVRWPQYTYQDRCVWRFGSTGCGFDTSSITITGSIITGSSTNLVLHAFGNLLSQSFSAGRFNFGRLTVTGGVNSGAIRTVRIHTGDLIHLSHALPVNSLAGLNFSIFPGCNKRYIDDCTSLYNNTENFFGFPWIPIQEDAFG